MRGDGRALVLDQHALHPGGLLHQPALQFRKGGGGAGDGRAAVDGPQLRAVQARDGEAGGGEQLVRIGKAAPRHQRQRPAEAGGHGGKVRRQRQRHLDGVRRHGKVDQRAVDIEEEGPAVRLGEQAADQMADRRIGRLQLFVVV